MAALTKGRNTTARSGDMTELPAKAGVRVFAGAMVAVDATGHAVPMATADNLRGLGRSENEFDNREGADGDILVRTGRGIFNFDNSAAADEITAADIGSDCYGVDDQTVALTDGGGTRSFAGKIHDVDAAGVWVDFR
ncbi:hypothetical protein [Aliihoeflea sp. PC F10.4]